MDHARPDDADELEAWLQAELATIQAFADELGIMTAGAPPGRCDETFLPPELCWCVVCRHPAVGSS